MHTVTFPRDAVYQTCEHENSKHEWLGNENGCNDCNAETGYAWDKTSRHPFKPRHFTGETYSPKDEWETYERIMQDKIRQD